MKHFKKALSVLLAFSMVLSLLVVGMTAAAGNTASATRGVDIYMYDDVNEEWVLLDMGTATTLKPGTLLKATSWLTSPDAYPTDVTAAVYYDTRVFQPVILSLDGSGLPDGTAPTVITATSGFDGTYGPFAGIPGVTGDGYVDDFVWAVAYPPSIKDMLEMEEANDPGWFIGAQEILTYYPAAWFNKTTDDIDYDMGSFQTGEFCLPIKAYEENYRVVIAKGGFSLDLYGPAADALKSKKGSAQADFIDFYFQIDPAVTAADIPAGGAKIGLPKEAIAGYTISESDDGWEKVDHDDFDTLWWDGNGYTNIISHNASQSPVYIFGMMKETLGESQASGGEVHFELATQTLDPSQSTGDALIELPAEPGNPIATFIPFGETNPANYPKVELELAGPNNDVTSKVTPTADGPFVKYIYVPSGYDVATIALTDALNLTKVPQAEATYVEIAFRQYELVYTDADDVTIKLIDDGWAPVGREFAWGPGYPQTQFTADDGDGTEYNYTGDTNLPDDKVEFGATKQQFYAQYAKAKFKVIFAVPAADSAKFEAYPPVARELDWGDTVTLPAEPVGVSPYKFKGWKIGAAAYTGGKATLTALGTPASGDGLADTEYTYYVYAEWEDTTSGNVVIDVTVKYDVYDKDNADLIPGESFEDTSVKFTVKPGDDKNAVAIAFSTVWFASAKYNEYIVSATKKYEPVGIFESDGTTPFNFELADASEIDDFTVVVRLKKKIHQVSVTIPASVTGGAPYTTPIEAVVGDDIVALVGALFAAHPEWQQIDATVDGLKLELKYDKPLPAGVEWQDGDKQLVVTDAHDPSTPIDVFTFVNAPIQVDYTVKLYGWDKVNGDYGDEATITQAYSGAAKSTVGDVLAKIGYTLKTGESVGKVTVSGGTIGDATTWSSGNVVPYTLGVTNGGVISVYIQAAYDVYEFYYAKDFAFGTEAPKVPDDLASFVAFPVEYRYYADGTFVPAIPTKMEINTATDAGDDYSATGLWYNATGGAVNLPEPGSALQGGTIKLYAGYTTEKLADYTPYIKAVQYAKALVDNQDVQLVRTVDDHASDAYYNYTGNPNPWWRFYTDEMVRLVYELYNEIDFINNTVNTTVADNPYCVLRPNYYYTHNVGGYDCYLQPSEATGTELVQYVNNTYTENGNKVIMGTLMPEYVFTSNFADLCRFQFNPYGLFYGGYSAAEQYKIDRVAEDVVRMMYVPPSEAYGNATYDERYDAGLYYYTNTVATQRPALASENWVNGWDTLFKANMTDLERRGTSPLWEGKQNLGPYNTFSYENWFAKGKHAMILTDDIILVPPDYRYTYVEKSTLTHNYYERLAVLGSTDPTAYNYKKFEWFDIEQATNAQIKMVADFSPFDGVPPVGSTTPMNRLMITLYARADFDFNVIYAVWLTNRAKLKLTREMDMAIEDSLVRCFGNGTLQSMGADRLIKGTEQFDALTKPGLTTDYETSFTFDYGFPYLASSRPLGASAATWTQWSGSPWEVNGTVNPTNWNGKGHGSSAVGLKYNYMNGYAEPGWEQKVINQYAQNAALIDFPLGVTNNFDTLFPTQKPFVFRATPFSWSGRTGRGSFDENAHSFDWSTMTSSAEADGGWVPYLQAEYQLINGATFDGANKLTEEDILLDENFIASARSDYRVVPYYSSIPLYWSDGVAPMWFSIDQYKYTHLTLINEYKYIQNRITFLDEKGVEIKVSDPISMGTTLSTVTDLAPAGYTKGAWLLKDYAGTGSIADGDELFADITEMPGEPLTFQWTPYYTLSFYDGYNKTPVLFHYKNALDTEVVYEIDGLKAGDTLTGFTFKTVEDWTAYTDYTWKVTIDDGKDVSTYVLTGVTTGTTVAEALLAATGSAKMPAGEVTFTIVSGATIKFYTAIDKATTIKSDSVPLDDGIQLAPYAPAASDAAVLAAAPLGKKLPATNAWTPITPSPALTATIDVEAGAVYEYYANWANITYTVTFQDWKAASPTLSTEEYTVATAGGVPAPAYSAVDFGNGYENKNAGETLTWVIDGGDHDGETFDPANPTLFPAADGTTAITVKPARKLKTLDIIFINGKATPGEIKRISNLTMTGKIFDHLPGGAADIPVETNAAYYDDYYEFNGWSFSYVGGAGSVNTTAQLIDHLQITNMPGSSVTITLLAKPITYLVAFENAKDTTTLGTSKTYTVLTAAAGVESPDDEVTFTTGYEATDDPIEWVIIGGVHNGEAFDPTNPTLFKDGTTTIRVKAQQKTISLDIVVKDAKGNNLKPTYGVENTAVGSDIATLLTTGVPQETAVTYTAAYYDTYYKFGGWTVNWSGKAGGASTFATTALLEDYLSATGMPAATVTIQLVAAPIEYTVNWVADAAGHFTAGFPQFTTYTVLDRNKAPTGVTFAAGYKADGYSTDITNLPMPTGGATSINVTVKSQLIEYTVNWIRDVVGHFTAGFPQSTTYTVEDRNKAPTGVTFAAGYKADGYSADITNLPLPVSPATSIDVTVKSTPIVYTVTFLPVSYTPGRIKSVADPAVLADRQYTVETKSITGVPAVVYEDDYEANGYTLNADGTGSVGLTNGTLPVPVPGGGTTLTVYVKAKGLTNSIVFKDGYGNVIYEEEDVEVDSTPFKGTGALTVPEVTAARVPQYKKFTGWIKSVGGVDTAFNAAGFADFVMPNGTVEFIMGCDWIVYQVNFVSATYDPARLDSLTNPILADRQYTMEPGKNKVTAMPSVTYKAGYEADGYSLNGNGTGAVDFNDLPAPTPWATATALTVYVKAKPIVYTVEFVGDSNVATITPPAVLTYTMLPGENKVSAPGATFIPGYELRPTNPYTISGVGTANLNALPIPAGGATKLQIMINSLPIDYKISFLGQNRVYKISTLDITGKHVGQAIPAPTVPAPPPVYADVDAYLIAMGLMSPGYTASWSVKTTVGALTAGTIINFGVSLMPAGDIELVLVPVPKLFKVTFVDGDNSDAVLAVTNVAVDSRIPAASAPAIPHNPVDEIVVWTVVSEGPLKGNRYIGDNFPLMPAADITLRSSVDSPIVNVYVHIPGGSDTFYQEGTPDGFMVEGLDPVAAGPGMHGYWFWADNNPAEKSRDGADGSHSLKINEFNPDDYDDGSGEIRIYLETGEEPVDEYAPVEGLAPGATVGPIHVGGVIPTPAGTPTIPDGTTFGGWQAEIPDPSNPSGPPITVPLHVGNAADIPAGLSDYYKQNPAGGYDLILANKNPGASNPSPTGQNSGMYVWDADQQEWVLGLTLVATFVAKGGTIALDPKGGYVVDDVNAVVNPIVIAGGLIPNGGSKSLKELGIPFNQKAVKEGFKFTGWKIKGTDTVFTADTQITSAMIEAGLILEAQYEEIKGNNGDKCFIPIPIILPIPIVLPIPIILPIDLGGLFDWWKDDGICCGNCGCDDCDGSCCADPADPADPDDDADLDGDTDGDGDFYPVDTGDYKGYALLAAMGLGFAGAGVVVFRKKKEEDEEE